MDLQSLINPVIEIAHNAGDELMKFYKNDYKIQSKDNGSIVTEADFASDKIIREKLSQLTPDIPIVTEETIDDFKDIDLSSKTYWCVDPLDGTKVFKNEEDEFSILIALIQEQQPVFGIAYFPVLDKTYYATLNNVAYLIDKKNHKKLKIIHSKSKDLIVMTYKNHGDVENSVKLAKLFPSKSLVKRNTAHQHTLIAENSTIDVFCQYAETAGEWDVAANQNYFRRSRRLSM